MELPGFIKKMFDERDRVLDKNANLLLGTMMKRLNQRDPTGKKYQDFLFLLEQADPDSVHTYLKKMLKREGVEYHGGQKFREYVIKAAKDQLALKRALTAHVEFARLRTELVDVKHKLEQRIESRSGLTGSQRASLSKISGMLGDTTHLDELHVASSEDDSTDAMSIDSSISGGDKEPSQEAQDVQKGEEPVEQANTADLLVEISVAEGDQLDRALEQFDEALKQVEQITPTKDQSRVSRAFIIDSSDETMSEEADSEQSPRSSQSSGPSKR